MTISEGVSEKAGTFEPPVSLYGGRKTPQRKAEQFQEHLPGRQNIFRAALWGSLPSMTSITPIPSSPPTMIFIPQRT